MFLGTLLDLIREKFTCLKKKPTQSKKRKKNSKESISLLWSTLPGASDLTLVEPDQANGSVAQVEYWLNSTFDLNPLFILLFTTGWFWIFKKISSGQLSLLSVVVLSEAALFMCTLFTIVMLPNNDNSYELQNILYLLNLLAVEVVVAITIIIRVVSLRLNLDYSNLVLLTSSLYDVAAQLATLVVDLVLRLWDHLSTDINSSSAWGGGRKFQLTFAAELSPSTVKYADTIEFLLGAVSRRTNTSMLQISNLYDYYATSTHRLNYRYFVFGQNTTTSYEDTTAIINFSRPNSTFSQTTRRHFARNNILSRELLLGRSETTSLRLRGVYSTEDWPSAKPDRETSRFSFYARSLYRPESINFEFKNPHETMRVLELLEERILSQRLSASSQNSSYSNRFTNELGRYWDRHGSWASPGVQNLILQDKISYLDAEAYKKSIGGGLLESRYASNFVGKYISREWLPDYQTSYLTSDDELGWNTTNGPKGRMYPVSWRSRHSQLSDRGVVSTGRSRHLEQIQDLNGVYVRTLQWLQDRHRMRRSWAPAIRKVHSRGKKRRNSSLRAFAMNANYTRKMYRLRGSAWNTQVGGRQKYIEKTKRPRRYLIDALHKNLWSSNFIDSLGRWTVDRQSSHLEDIKRPKARVFTQKDARTQRKSYTSHRIANTPESSTTAEVGEALDKKKLRGRATTKPQRVTFARQYWGNTVNRIVKGKDHWSMTHRRKSITIKKRQRDRLRVRRKHIRYIIDPGHWEATEYNAEDASYNRQKFKRANWVWFLQWSDRLRFSPFLAAPRYADIRDREYGLSIFDLYYKHVDRTLSMRGLAHTMYKAENKDIRSFKRNATLERVAPHTLGNFVEEVDWPELYFQKFVPYRKRRRKRSRMFTGMHLLKNRRVSFRVLRSSIDRKRYVPSKIKSHKTVGVHFNKALPVRWWTHSGMHSLGGAGLNNFITAFGNVSTTPALVTNSDILDFIRQVRQKTWQRANLYEYIVTKFCRWFNVRGHVSSTSNNLEVMFHVLTYLNFNGWWGAIKEYSWEFFLRYMIFSKIIVDLFFLYFYVGFELILQLPLIGDGFLRYAELVYSYSTVRRIWHIYLLNLTKVPSLVYELPGHLEHWLVCMLYTDPIKLTNNISNFFSYLRQYSMYSTAERSVKFWLKEAILNFTPGIIFYPIVDCSFWWKILGGGTIFGLPSLKVQIGGWCTSWVSTSESISVRKKTKLHETTVKGFKNRTRESVENYLKYPRKNRKKEKKRKPYRLVSYRAKVSALLRKWRQTLVNKELAREGRSGFGSYAEDWRYKKGRMNRFTFRKLPHMLYASRKPYTLIFKENAYVPDRATNLGSLLLATIEKQRRQAELLLAIPKKTAPHAYWSGSGGDLNFMEFIEHTSPKQTPVSTTNREHLGVGTISLKNFYSDYLRSKVAKHTYSQLGRAEERTIGTFLFNVVENIKKFKTTSFPQVTSPHPLRVKNTEVRTLHPYLKVPAPTGGQWEFFNLKTIIGRTSPPPLTPIERPESQITFKVPSNYHIDLFRQQKNELADGASVYALSYKQQLFGVWELSGNVLNKRQTHNPKPTTALGSVQYIQEVYETLGRYYRLILKQSQPITSPSKNLFENATSSVDNFWLLPETSSINKPPSYEPWGSRSSGPLISTDRGSLPWDEDFDSDSEVYDYSSIPLTSSELREEELIREPNSYALFQFNDFLSGSDPNSKGKKDRAMNRRVKSRYARELPIRKTLGRARPTSYLRMRGRKHRTDELGITQPKVDTFRTQKNKKKILYFEKMSKGLGSLIGQQEIFNSTWKNRGGYLPDNLPTISPRSKFKYRADGLRDFGMSQYLTPRSSPNLPYRPLKVNKIGPVAITGTILNNRPNLNEELELDGYRDELSIKTNLTTSPYKGQDLRPTDNTWTLATWHSPKIAKLKMSTRKKGDVLRPTEFSFVQKETTPFAQLSVNYRKVVQLRNFQDKTESTAYVPKSKLTLRKNITKLEKEGGGGGFASNIQNKKLTGTDNVDIRGYLDNTKTEIRLENKWGVGLDYDLYLTNNVGTKYGSKKPAERVLGVKVLNALTPLDLQNYGPTNVENNPRKFRKKYRKTLRYKQHVRRRAIGKASRLKSRRREPSASKKRLRAEQHIHFPYRKKKFWSQNESLYLENNIGGLVGGRREDALDKLGGHFIKTFVENRRHRRLGRFKVKSYFKSLSGGVSLRPKAYRQFEQEETIGPRHLRRRKLQKSSHRPHFPRRFFSSRELLNKQIRTASEFYYQDKLPQRHSKYSLRTWRMHPRPKTKLLKWAKKFKYKRLANRRNRNLFIADVTFYRKRKRGRNSLTNRMRDFKKEVLYAPSLIVPLGSKKSGNVFRESLDVLRASSYLRREEREFGSVETLSEPFVRYFRSSSALEDSVVFRSKKREFRKDRNLEKLVNWSSFDKKELVSLIFESKDPYFHTWLKPMSESRPHTDLAPSTLTSSRNLANTRNLSFYDEADLTWSLFQNYDLVDEDPEWPRFYQNLKKIRKRNTLYFINNSDFFAYQDSQTSERLKFAHLSPGNFLRAVSNYVYAEGTFGIPGTTIPLSQPLKVDLTYKRNLTKVQTSKLKESLTGLPISVKHLHTERLSSRLRFLKQPSNALPLHQSGIKFTDSTLCLDPVKTNSTVGIWARNLISQSFAQHSKIFIGGEMDYIDNMGQFLQNNKVQLVIPQRNLLVKYGSSKLNGLLVPLFVELEEKPGWWTWLFLPKLSQKIVLVWVRPEDIRLVLDQTDGLLNKWPKLDWQSISKLLEKTEKINFLPVGTEYVETLGNTETIKESRDQSQSSPQENIKQNGYLLGVLSFLQYGFNLWSQGFALPASLSQTINRTIWELYSNFFLFWTIFNHTSLLLHAKTCTLWLVSQAYCNVDDFWELAFSYSKTLKPWLVWVFKLNIWSSFQLFETLTSPSQIVAHHYGLVLSIWNMFWPKSSNSWEVGVGLFFYLLSEPNFNFIRIGAWSYFSAMPHRYGFVILYPLWAKWCY